MRGIVYASMKYADYQGVVHGSCFSILCAVHARSYNKARTLGNCAQAAFTRIME